MPAGSRLRRPGPWLSTTTVVVGLLFLFPAGYLAWESLSGGAIWSTVSSGAVLGPLSRSLLIATTTAALSAVLGTTLAWVVERTDLPGAPLWRVLLALPLVIPSFVGATALLAAFGRGGLVTFLPRISGFWGALVVLTLLSYPYVYLPVAARLRVTQASAEEASRLLGRGTWYTVRRVVLPQIRVSVVAGTLLVFLYGLSDFGAVSLMRYDTITRAIFSSRLLDRPRAVTLGLMLALLALAVAAGERAMIRREIVVPQGSARSIRYPLGRLRLVAASAVGSVLALALMAPIAVFLGWTVRGSAGIGEGFTGLGDSLTFLSVPLVNSVVASSVAAAVAVALLLPVALVMVRRPSVLGDAVSTVVSSVFALPGLVVALAIVFWAIRAPAPFVSLYQTFPLLILAYVIHFGVQSLRASETALASVPDRLDEAAQTLGAGTFRRFVTIDLPLIAPGVMAGAGLVLLSSLKELPATLLLAPIGFDTLATHIWDSAEAAVFAEVGVTALTLIFLSGVLTWVLVLRRGLDPTLGRRIATRAPVGS